MKNWIKSISVPQLLLEFVSVVFAVLLALGLNTYKETKAQQRDAEELRIAILEESKNNLAKIDSMLHRNQSFWNFLDSLVRVEPRKVEWFYFDYDYELLTSGAWQIALNSSAVQALDQTFMMEAAHIYQSQAFYMNFSQKAFENIGVFLSRKDDLSAANLALSMHYYLGVMNNYAYELRSNYMQFIEEHKNESIRKKS